MLILQSVCKTSVKHAKVKINVSKEVLYMQGIIITAIICGTILAIYFGRRDE